MTDDEVLAQLSDELRRKISRVPKKVMDGGVMTARSWKGDVEKSKKLLSKVRLTKDQLISQINVMDVWLQA